MHTTRDWMENGQLGLTENIADTAFCLIHFGMT